MAADPFEAEATAHEPGVAALPPQTPAERLALSRARMRSFLTEGGSKRRRKATVGDASGLPGIDLLMAKLKEHPVAAAVYDAVTNWWKSHPVHAFGVIAGAAARDAAGPLVRRYPLAMVCAALVAGAIVVRIKPWRFVLKSALFAGLASQVASRLVSAVPLDTVVATLMRFANRRGRVDEPQAGDPQAAAPQPAPPQPSAAAAPPA
ncbi:hypothetical protein V4F39_11950 [Aquincola sp. MAHUQ-54]|uniref:Uncharacterized protein n=1 Tax=Aquincola agrisoli TaxID=3119538 RepID=A0AAW9QG62_9BURK